jgi:hypothetical protein
MRYPDLLPTELERHNYDAFLDERASLLRDSVDFLTEAWHLMAAKLADVDCPSHTTVLMQCRNVIDLLDGIEILVRQGSSFNCFHLLRSAMEASWGMMWILAEDTERRGKAYQVGHAHRVIDFARRLDRRTAAHDQLRKSIAGQNHAQVIEGDNVDAAAVYETKAALLARPEYREIEQAWQTAAAGRKKKRRPGPPPWYSIFGGPETIRALAYEVKEGVAYETMYALHSNSVHAGNAFDHMSPAPDGEAKPVRPIRHPAWLTKVTSHSVNIAAGMVPLILTKYAPENGAEFRERYVVTLRPRILELLASADTDPRWP